LAGNWEERFDPPLILEFLTVVECLHPDIADFKVRCQIRMTSRSAFHDVDLAPRGGDAMSNFMVCIDHFFDCMCSRSS